MLTELVHVMTDPRFDRRTRLARLQGWRGADLDQALQAGWALSLAPAVCGAGGLLGGFLQSPLVLGLLGVTAVIGVVAANQPFEVLYNAIARRIGRSEVPPNRAAKRLGCFLGSVHLIGATVAFELGATTLGLVLSLSLGGLATFVALSGICVPSMLYTLFFGAERATGSTLLGSRPAAVHGG